MRILFFFFFFHPRFVSQVGLIQNKDREKIHGGARGRLIYEQKESNNEKGIKREMKGKKGQKIRAFNIAYSQDNTANLI